MEPADPLDDLDGFRLLVLTLRVEGFTAHEVADFLNEDHYYIETLYARSEELGEWNHAQQHRFAWALTHSHELARIKKEAAAAPQPTTRTGRRDQIVDLYTRGLPCHTIADLTGTDIVDIGRHLTTAARRGELTRSPLST